MHRSPSAPLVLSSAALGVLTLTTSGAAAQLVPYRGFDRVSTPSTAGATNALGAEGAWLAGAGALGSIHTVDFESMTPGTTGTIFTIAPGVTMRVASSYHTDFFSLEGGPTRYGAVDGFNTTVGGANHMRYDSGAGSTLQPAIQLDFAQPIAAFSLFLTGEGHSGLVGDAYSTRLYLNGSTQPAMFFGDSGFPYWPSRAQPNVKFGGFIDPTASITRVVIEPRFLSTLPYGRGSYSLDDIRWVPSPAPSAAALLAFGGVLITRRARR